jgi:hypothetical protein
MKATMASIINPSPQADLLEGDLTLIQIIERLRTSHSIRVRRGAGRFIDCKGLVHWVRVKDENIVIPPGTATISRGLRNLACVVIIMDFQGDVIHGRNINDLNLKQWVAVCRRLGAYQNVLQRLGLTSDEMSQVVWRTDPFRRRYFHRNQFLASHWKLHRIAEENPHLKILSLSLSEMVAQAERASSGAQLILPESTSEGGPTSSPAPE